MQRSVDHKHAAQADVPWEAMREVAHALKADAIANLDVLLEQFERRFQERGGKVVWARSADEAERINRGEDISTRQEDQDAAAEALAAAGEFFDPEARRDDVEPEAGAASDK